MDRIEIDLFLQWNKEEYNITVGKNADPVIIQVFIMFLDKERENSRLL